MSTCMQRDKKTVLGLIDYNLFYVKEKMDKTLEIAFRVSPKQLDHAVPVFEQLLQDMLEERQKGAHLTGELLSRYI